MGNNGRDVDNYLEKIRDNKLREIAKELRKDILESVPSANEVVKHGKLIYTKNGPICSLINYDSFIKVEFKRGKELADPKKILEDSIMNTNNTKSIIIYDLDGIDREYFKELVKQAADLNTYPSLPEIINLNPSHRDFYKNFCRVIFLCELLEEFKSYKSLRDKTPFKCPLSQFNRDIKDPLMKNRLIVKIMTAKKNSIYFGINPLIRDRLKKVLALELEKLINESYKMSGKLDEKFSSKNGDSDKKRLVEEIRQELNKNPGRTLESLLYSHLDKFREGLPHASIEYNECRYDFQKNIIYYFIFEVVENSVTEDDWKTLELNRKEFEKHVKELLKMDISTNLRKEIVKKREFIVLKMSVGKNHNKSKNQF